MTAAEEEPGVEPERLEALARRLHHDPTRVTELYEASERFREIYEDYATCQETLDRFRQLGRVDEAQVRDYGEMREQLELELRACLELAARKEK